MQKMRENGTAKKKVQCYSYCLQDKVGKGYSSQVYKGRNDLTSEEVAMKVIDMKMIKGQTHRNLLQEETQVLKLFRSPQNVIEVFDIYKTRQHTFIITEYCKDGDLSKIIKQGLPQPEAVQYLKQIVSGYMQIWNKKIIHRDLKPANILLKNKRIKIADFGFATKQVQNQKKFPYNVGSPIYMPPEALNENIYSSKSDIWAIGIIFYEMLTGKTPWRAKTEKDLSKMLKSVPIQKLLPKNISDQSANFLIKALNPNLHERLAAYELQEELKNFKHDLSKCKSSSILKHLPQKSQNFLERNNHFSSSKNSLKKLTKMNFYPPKQELKSCSLPKTAATIKTKTEKQLNTSVEIKQTSKELLSQVHFFRFVYKLVQRIKKYIEEDNEAKNLLMESMVKLLIFLMQGIKNLRVLTSEKRKAYGGSEDFSKIRKIVEQYELKYEREMQISHRQSVDEQYGSVKQKISKFIRSNLQQIQSINEETKNEAYIQKIIIIDYLITFKQLLDLHEGSTLNEFHTSSEIEKIVEGNPVKFIKKEHIRGIMSKLRKTFIV